MEDASAVPEDDVFIIKVSESMDLRNRLRSGLVDAQNKDSGKIPMLVSWPKWLDDGIVCMYARDFRGFMNEAVRQTAATFGAVNAGNDDEVSADDKNGVFKKFDITSLDRIPSAGKKTRRGVTPDTEARE